MKIFVDPGHSGEDPGAVVEKTSEKDLNLQIAKLVETIARGKGHIVMLSRESDKTLSLKERCYKANDYNYEVFVSIHCNAHSSNAEGFEVCYVSSNGKKVAGNITESFDCIVKRKNRGIKKRKNLYVLNKTKMTAVLIECGFMTNTTELHLLRNRGYQWILAEAIVSGLEKGVK